MSELGRLTRHVREADDQRHLADRVGELEARRQRERRVDPGTQDEDFDLPARHRARQARDLGIRRHLPVRRIGAEPHGLPHVAGCRVQEIDRDLRLGGVGPRDRDAPADGEPRLGAGERFRDVLDGLDTHTALVRGALHVDRRDRFAEASIGRSLVDHHTQDRQGEQPFRARRVADPFVRVRRRQGLTRLDVDERARASVPERVHAGEGPRVVDVREPRLDEVGAEGQHDLGVLERVVRNRVTAEREAIRRADRLVGERLQGHARARAERLRPAIEHPAQTAVLELCHDRDRAALAAGAERPDPVGDGLGGGVPRGALESRASLADLGAGDAIGMIEALERGLAAHAERAGIDGMVGVALELDDPTLAIARDDAAARPGTRGTRWRTRTRHPG